MDYDSGIVNRRQYVLTNFECAIENFECEKFGKYYLYYHADLKIRRIEDKYGRCWLLLGEVYSVREMGSTPEKELSGTDFTSIEDIYFYWTGRWCLWGNDEIHTDATGMMSLYYYFNRGKWIISPSLNLIYNVFIDDFKGFIQTMTPNGSIDWHPAPLTKLKGVCRAFNSQKLCIVGDYIKPYYRDVISYDFAKKNCEEKSKLLTKYMCNAVYNISKYSDRKIWLALTAGTDSRITLAALLKMNIPFSTYTFHHEAISRGDKNIPLKLADKYGFDHIIIKRAYSKADKKLLRKYDEHTFYGIDDADRKFYGYGQYAQIPDDAITIKSVFEICRGFYYKKIRTQEDFERKIRAHYPDIDTYSNYHESIDMWFKWANENTNHMDIRDRFYMEERIGGWLSALQQSLDMFPMVQIQITNCSAILSAGYWYSQQDKEENRIVYEQIRNMEESLLDIPMNPPEYWYIIKICMKKGIRHPIVTLKKVMGRIARKK
jgi:hypothetical protein